MSVSAGDCAERFAKRAARKRLEGRLSSRGQPHTRGQTRSERERDSAGRGSAPSACCLTQAFARSPLADAGIWGQHVRPLARDGGHRSSPLVTTGSAHRWPSAIPHQRRSVVAVGGWRARRSRRQTRAARASLKVSVVDPAPHTAHSGPNWTTASAGAAVRFSFAVYAHSSHKGGHTNADACSRGDVDCSWAARIPLLSSGVMSERRAAVMGWLGRACEPDRSALLVDSTLSPPEATLARRRLHRV
jgi:hypothetical protein